MFGTGLGVGGRGRCPEWSCGCRHCADAGRDPGRARTGCSVAVNADGSAWTVLNAPAELPSQLARSRALRPRRGVREAPFDGLVLTDAELDHTLGQLIASPGRGADGRRDRHPARAACLVSSIQLPARWHPPTICYSRTDQSERSLASAFRLG